MLKDKSLFLAKKITRRILPLRQWDFNCQTRADFPRWPPDEKIPLSKCSEGFSHLVDGLQRRTNACLKISLHSVTIVLSILPKRIHH